MNHFWRIMERLFGIDPGGPYERRVVDLLAAGVAVWDVIARCQREGSGDDAIESEQPNRLLELLDEHPDVRHIAFNGSMAWQTARRHLPEVFRSDRVQCERMPSTSPKHATRTLEEKVAEWARIKPWLMGTE
jgi:hypoxanthine-DNA glycosylase